MWTVRADQTRTCSRNVKPGPVSKLNADDGVGVRPDDPDGVLVGGDPLAATRRTSIGSPTITADRRADQRRERAGRPDSPTQTAPSDTATPIGPRPTRTGAPARCARDRVEAAATGPVVAVGDPDASSVVGEADRAEPDLDGRIRRRPTTIHASRCRSRPVTQSVAPPAVTTRTAPSAMRKTRRILATSACRSRPRRVRRSRSVTHTRPRAYAIPVSEPPASGGLPGPSHVRGSTAVDSAARRARPTPRPLPAATATGLRRPRIGAGARSPAASSTCNGMVHWSSATHTRSPSTVTADGRPANRDDVR